MAETRSRGSRPGEPGREPTGQVRQYRASSGVSTYSLRVRWRGERISIRLGSELEGWNRPLAELKLAETIKQIKEGTWQPPAPDIDPEDNDPNFHEFATVWLETKRPDLAPSTYRDYSRILTRFILPAFKSDRPSEINYERVIRWRDGLRLESEQLELAKKNHLTLLDRNGKPKRAFGAARINDAVRLLGQILDRAVESEHYLIDRNPAKGRSGLRVKTPPKPPRNHLEADELLSLIQAADLIDQGVSVEAMSNATLARELRSQDVPWAEIATTMGCSEATAIYRSRIRPRTDAARRRRFMIVMLALTGTRASEHTLLSWDRVDETHGRLVLETSKTHAGIREIQLTPFVREELALYKESMHLGREAAGPVFPVRGGGYGDRFNLARRINHVVDVANDLRAEQSHAPLPKRITPHTFRRTFVTLSFQAGRDLVYVQSQVGHADWKTTLEIYTQVSHRSVDAEIQALLAVFLGEPRLDEARAAAAAREPFHRRLEFV